MHTGRRNAPISRNRENRFLGGEGFRIPERLVILVRFQLQVETVPWKHRFDFRLFPDVDQYFTGVDKCSRDFTSNRANPAVEIWRALRQNRWCIPSTRSS